MTAQYFTVLTDYGTQAFAKAIATNQPIQFSSFAVGDGNGQAVTPTADRTALVKEIHRANVSAVSLDPRNNKQIIIELTIPEDVGGFYIREMGVFDSTNKLVAYANAPESFKPTLESGSGKVQVLRMILKVSNSQAVTLSIDNSVIFVTRQQLNPKKITSSTTNGFDESGHTHEIEKADTTKAGIVQLTDDTGLDSDKLGLSARAGKKLAQLISTVQLALGNYIPNNKKSNSVTSNSNEDVATSSAVKTAYDKGVEAKTAADNANNNANGRVSKDGDMMTGAFNIKNGEYSQIDQFNKSNRFSRIETSPDNRQHFYKISYWDGASELHSALLPKRGLWKVLAYEDWVNDTYVPRIGDTLIKGRPTFENDGGGFISIKSNNVNWAALDYKVWNSNIPQVTAQAEDLGNYSVAFNVFTTPEGTDYNTDRREKTVQIHPSGRIWSKEYGWLDNKFATVNNIYQKSKWRNYWFANHYAGAQVVDQPVSDDGGIRITWMSVKVLGFNPPYIDVYLPMAYGGFTKAIAVDDGEGCFSYGTEIIGNNIVRVYCKNRGDIGFSLQVIGWVYY